MYIYFNNNKAHVSYLDAITFVGHIQVHYKFLILMDRVVSIIKGDPQQTVVKIHYKLKYIKQDLLLYLHYPIYLQTYLCLN